MKIPDGELCICLVGVDGNIAGNEGNLIETIGALHLLELGVDHISSRRLVGTDYTEIMPLRQGE